jgi:hypothetical protein
LANTAYPSVIARLIGSNWAGGSGHRPAVWLLVTQPDVLDCELHQVGTDLVDHIADHPLSVHLGHALRAALEDVTE